MADKFSNFDKIRAPFKVGLTNDVSGSTGTAGTAAVITAANSRFGIGSLQLSGTVDSYVDFSGAAIDNFPALAEWSIDFWTFANSINNDQVLLSVTASAVTAVTAVLNTNGSITLTLAGSLDESVSLSTSSNIFTIGRWTHLSLVKTPSSVSIYVNGNRRSQISLPQTFAGPLGTSIIRLGNLPAAGSQGLAGLVSMLRVSEKSRWNGSGHVLPLDDFNQYSPNVTITPMGTRTWKAVVDIERDQNAIMSAIESIMNDSGWETWDIYNEWGRSHLVFRSTNKDQVTKKYAVFIVDKSLWQMTLTTCEYWDPNNKSMLNESWTGERSTRVPYTSGNCEIWIFSSSRWAGIQSWCNDSPSLFQMVTEIERETREDVDQKSTPCWGHISSCMWSFAYVADSEAYRKNYISLPRTLDGRTGSAAAQYQTVISSVAAFGNFGLINKKPADVYYSDAPDAAGKLQHAFDSSKILIQTFKLSTHNNLGNYSNYGRIYGIKLVPYMGNNYDRVQVPIDSDGFFSNTAVPEDHWVIDLPANHRATYNDSGAGMTVSSWAVPNAATTNCMVYAGRVLYIGTDAGVSRVDTVTGVSAAVTGPNGIVYDITYDGRYVYASTSVGISRIDTASNDQHTSLTIGAGGAFSLTWDGWDRIYASQRTASATPSVYAVNTGSFSQIGPTMTLPSGRVQSMVIRSLSTDGFSTLVGTLSNTATASDTGVAIVNLPANSISYLAYGSGTVTNGNFAIQWTGFQYIAMMPNVASFGMQSIPNIYSTTGWTARMPGNLSYSPASANVKISIWMDPGAPHAFPGSNSTTISSGYNSDFGGYAVGAFNSTGGLNIGNLGLSSPTRAVYSTGSQVFGASGGNIYYVSKVHKHKYSSPTRTFSQMLIPR